MALYNRSTYQKDLGVNRISVLLAALTLFLHANTFFPQTVETHVVSVKNGKIKTASAQIKPGMSAMVLHKYSQTYEAISVVAVAQNDGWLNVVDGDIVPHESLPTPRQKVSVGDRVIGGYLYDRVVAIVPSKELYRNITSGYDKEWLHPDHLALFMAKEGEDILTKEMAKAFAKTHHIGLMLIATQKALLLYDPMSGSVVGKKPFHTQSLQAKGFYHRLGRIRSGFFGGSKIAPYENIIGALVK